MTLWLKFIPTGSFNLPLVINADRSPCPAVMAGGMNTLSPEQHYIEDDGVDLFSKDPGKPAYRVPSMDEVRAVPWNGLTVASTFAGCGGSSTGYRMAGYRVVWANEFVPAAQDSYAANKADYTVLDRRDIREVTALEILQAIKMKPGELDVFDGSPPCQAFSTAGQRHRGWGKERDYGNGSAGQKNEDMFFEYVRLLEGLMPRVFVAENVSGLVKGVAKGYFIEILRRLKACGYRVEARLLDAQWLGVPQSRQRIIFVGVRDDLGLDPAFPTPLPYRYSVREACPWLGSQKVMHETDGAFRSGGDVTNSPAPSVVAGRNSFNVVGVVHDDGRPGNKAKDVLDRPCPAITAGPADAATGGGQRNHFKIIEPAQSLSLPPSRAPGGYGVKEVDPNAPAPTVTCGSPGNDLAVRMAVGNRAFEPIMGGTDQPSPSIIASGARTAGLVETGEGAKVERRKFTIAELRRIGAFPDDFVLTGSYAQQWERIGNSVPPLMMRAIASAVRDAVLLPARDARARSSTATPRASGRARVASSPASPAKASSRAPRSRRPAPAAPSGAT